jgi:putative hydrolase of the HAD superfamily
MNTKAVIFDLFGTLVDERADDYAVMMARMASVLGVTVDALYAETRADARRRNLGEYESVAQQFDVMCERLDVAPGIDAVAAAARAYTELQRSRLVPRDGVLLTLDHLAELGVRRGIISNAAQVTVDLWPSTVFPLHVDASLLSAALKMAKPEPAIYRAACRELGVKAGECVYVGDGGDNELTGATEVGMRAVLIRPPYADATAFGAARQAWDGDTIASIPEVLGLLD